MKLGLINKLIIPQFRNIPTAQVNGDRLAKGGQKCWVWCKGNPLEPDSGEWKAGWYGSVAPLGGIRYEHYDYVPCRLPQWRVSWDEPKDLKTAPETPEGAEWKHWPVDWDLMTTKGLVQSTVIKDPLHSPHPLGELKEPLLCEQLIALVFRLLGFKRSDSLVECRVDIRVIGINLLDQDFV